MIFEPLFNHAQRQPQNIAIIDDRGQYTYQQLEAMAAGLGLYLSMQTRKPRVGLLLPAGAGFVASFYGALLASKTVVPINFLLGDKEIAHIIKDSEIDTVVTIPLSWMMWAISRSPSRKLIGTTVLPARRVP